MTNLKRRLEIAAQAAWEAGKVTLRHFQTRLAVELKGDRTPVTVADRESEATLRSILLKEFPGDGFLGEESGESLGTTGLRWVVDPIDGTKSFVQGVPLYGVMVALEDSAGEALVGAVCLPALSDLVVAGKGEGCFWNGRRASVSTVPSLAQSCVCYTSERTFEQAGAAD